MRALLTSLASAAVIALAAPAAQAENLDVLMSGVFADNEACLLYTSPSPRDRTRSRMPSSA